MDRGTDKKEIATNEDEEEKEEPNNSTIDKKLREKKPLPGVKFLLEHGDPDSPPPTFKETVTFMAALFITFVGSLIVWHFLFLKDAGPGQKKDWSNIEL
jgi:hypothetical protein